MENEISLAESPRRPANGEWRKPMGFTPLSRPTAQLSTGNQSSMGNGTARGKFQPGSSQRAGADDASGLAAEALVGGASGMGGGVSQSRASPTNR